MKKFIILLTTVLSVMSASAQTTETTTKSCCEKQCCNEFNPSWFVNLQGGIQIPSYKVSGLTSPVFSLNVGRNITRLMSARIGVEGVNSKVMGYTGKENFKYATGNFDAMLNVSNIFTKSNCHPLNLYFIAGVGCNWTGAENTSSSSFSPNFRLGAQLDWRVAKNLALNLEYRADNTSDIFNGQLKNGNHDWYTAVMVGVSLVLPDRKPVKVKDNTAEINALKARINELQAENEALKNRKPEVVTNTVVEKEAILPNVFFDCAKSKITLKQSANVKAIADYLQANPDQNVTITGYASPEGKAKFNQKLSEDRANAVAEMLVKKYGISRDRIFTQAGGPTSAIYPERNLNRVAVSVSKK